MDRLDTVDLTACERDMYVMGDDVHDGEFAIQIFSLEWHDYCTVGSVRHTKAAQIVQKAMQAPSFDVRTIARVTNSVAKQRERQQLDMKIAKAVAFTKAVVYCHQTQTRRTLDGSALNQAEEDVVGVCRDDIDVMKYATGDYAPETGNYRLKQSAQMVISTCTRWRCLFNIRTSEEVVSIQLTSREARWQTNVADAITTAEWL